MTTHTPHQDHELVTVQASVIFVMVVPTGYTREQRETKAQRLVSYAVHDAIGSQHVTVELRDARYHWPAGIAPSSIPYGGNGYTSCVQYAPEMFITQTKKETQ